MRRTCPARYMTSFPNVKATMNVYFGDIHNHCAISYGHGPLEAALDNARQQLDFCSVTGHAHWPDMPSESGRLDALVQYHLDGFAKLEGRWPAVLDQMNAANVPGRFVTFVGFEWHNMRSGDHTILYRDGRGDLLKPDTIETLHAHVAELNERGIVTIAYPHHIGYKTGWRGINWAHFDARCSPIVEIVSMHGGSETDESPRPFLHTMGPCDGRSTMRYGLDRGHVFGVVGSTDHHSAFPGSYGHGRMAVWAEDLTRKAIWEAILARRTYALTGDRIVLDFRLNDAPMGSCLSEPTRERDIRIDVRGGSVIDAVEVIRNGITIYRSDPVSPPNDVMDGEAPIRARLLLELGWGAKGHTTDWDVRFGIGAGRILAVEPRFRGPEIVAPTEETGRVYAFSRCERTGEREVRIRTRTEPNPTTSTSATQGIALEVEMAPTSDVWADFGGGRVAHTLRELLSGARVGYTGGFVSAAYRFARAVLPAEYEQEIAFTDRRDEPANGRRDWYYVRVRQTNGQWAWSSPIWVAV